MLSRTLIRVLSSQISEKLRAPLELVERDIILHALLAKIYTNDELAEKVVFRGGTCLVKCHLGYYRFSEDLDFVSVESPKRASRVVQQVLNSISLLLEGLDFEKYEEKWFGTRKRKLWVVKYRNKGTGELLKLEVLFGEKQLFDYVSMPAKTLLDWKGLSLSGVPKPILEVYRPVNVVAYSLEEILAEKFRALLTRRELHARDVYDIYMISTKGGLGLENVVESAVEKILSTAKRLGERRQKDFFDMLTQRVSSRIMGINLEKEKYLFLEPPKISESFLKELDETAKTISEKVLKELSLLIK